MDTNLYQAIQKDAETIAIGAMDILESLQGHEVLAVKKDEVDISTSADIQAEDYIISQIQKRYPTHSIYSEERGEIKGSENYTWVIDPLDQTKEYTRGINEYNCLIGVFEGDTPIAGVTLQHGIDIMYSSSKGNGAWCNGKRIHVSAQTIFENAFIGCTLPNRKIDEHHISTGVSIIEDLIRTVYRVRPFWDQAKIFGWVSKGAFDGSVGIPGVYKWHDIASSLCTVHEAGGTVTDWHGDPLTYHTHMNGFICSNGLLQQQLVSIIKK